MIHLPFSFTVIAQLKNDGRRTIENEVRFKRGIYYWFATTEALCAMDIDPQSSQLHKLNIGDEVYFLLYIGIGPRDTKTQTQFIKQRILNRHLGASIGSSTLRFAIASKLRMAGYSSLSGTKKKCHLPDEDEAILTSFIMQEFLVGIEQNEEPWALENAKISFLQPPLNLKGNTNGWYYSTMKYARNIFKSRACRSQRTCR